MVSDKFRRQLRASAQQWLAAGLIDAGQYQKLSELYQFDSIETAVRNRFIALLIGLGGILLGIGVITLVAANWQALTRQLKATLLLMLFAGINAAGFYVWRRPGWEPVGTQGWRQRLGQGLLLLGALILGANMLLMSQMFHRSGSLPGFLMAWGLGVLAMAYSLRVTSLAVLAILAIALGYWPAWYESDPSEGFSWMRLIVQHMPLLAGVVFVPLAYWCQSRVVFVIGAVAAVSSLEFNLLLLPLPDPSVLPLLLVTLPPALLWSYDDSLFLSSLPSRLQLPETSAFSPLTRSLAILFLSVLFYALSFHSLWPLSAPFFQSVESESRVSLLQVFDVMVFSGWTVWAWLRLVFSSKFQALRRLDISDAFFACFVAIANMVLFWYFHVSFIPAIATFIFNILLFLLAYGLIRQGFTTNQRRIFWMGMMLFTLQIISRVFEYRTGLLLKALVFVLCGAGVITIGLWFEHLVHTHSEEPAVPIPADPGENC